MVQNKFFDVFNGINGIDLEQTVCFWPRAVRWRWMVRDPHLKMTYTELE